MHLSLYWKICKNSNSLCDILKAGSFNVQLQICAEYLRLCLKAGDLASLRTIKTLFIEKLVFKKYIQSDSVYCNSDVSNPGS